MSTLRLVPVSGHPIDVVKDQSTVGRDPSCEIVVTDGSVSRRHARLERRGAEWWVVDQGSANGTYINSLRVAEQALKDGQELRFGALAFRADIVLDPEATVATPILEEDSAATLMAAGQPTPTPRGMPPISAPVPPIPIPTPTAPRPSLPPPIPRAATPPAPPATKAAAPAVPPLPAAGPPQAAGARVSPVRPMAPGAAPVKKGRSPVFWVIMGCCGCLLLVLLFAGVIGGGVYMSTKGAADAAHAWIVEVRQGGADAATGRASSEYPNHVSQEANLALAAAIHQSTDATFYSRSIENDRAVMKGVLTGGGSRQAITIHLVKQGGEWKVDDVTLGVE